MVSGGLPSLQITLTWSDVRHPWHESVKLFFFFCRCHPSELRKASGRLKVPELHRLCRTEGENLGDSSLEVRLLCPTCTLPLENLVSQQPAAAPVGLRTLLVFAGWGVGGHSSSLN